MSKFVTIHNLSRLVTPIEAEYCDTALGRMRGLTFRRSLATGHGMLLVNRRENRLEAAIHTLFMNFDLALIWIDHRKRVVDTRLAPCWRPLFVPLHPASHVLEMGPERLLDFQPGDQLDYLTK